MTLTPRSEKDASAVLLRCEALLARPINAREASETLGALARLHQAQSRTQPSNEHILDDTFDDPHAITDVAALKGEMDHTLLSARREMVHGFLARLDGIVEDLEALDHGLTQLHATTTAAQRQARTAAALCGPLLASAQPAQDEAVKAQTDHALAELFIRRFTLPPELVTALDQADTHVDPTTFQAFDRLARIRMESQSLLAGSDSDQGGGIRAGVDVMDRTSAQLDRALNRLAQWLSTRFRDPSMSQLELPTGPGSDLVSRAVERLHREHKDELLRPTLTELAERRSRVVLQAFDTALRHGSGPGGKPIEAQAHDPLRYVGDMLAWVHQATAGEREVFATLLRLPNPDDTSLPNVATRRIGARRHGVDSGSVDLSHNPTSFDAGTAPTLCAVEQAICDLVNKALAPLARPLRDRILHVIAPSTSTSNLDVLTLLRLAHILDFYRVTLRRTLGKVEYSTLVLAVQDLTRRAGTAFDAALNRHAATIRSAEPQEAAHDLGCPSYIGSEASAFRTLLQTASAATPSGDDGTLDTQARHVAQVQLASIVTQFVGAMEAFCDRAAQQLTVLQGGKEGNTKFAEGIFLVNCYSTILSALRSAGSAEPVRTTIERLERQRAERVNALTTTHTQRLLQQTGLETLAHATYNDGPLSQQPGCDPEEVRTSMQMLGSVLRTDAPLESRSLTSLTDPSIRSSLHATALVRVAEAYERIVNRLRDTGSGYEGASSLVELEPRDVRLLLGVAE